MKKLKRILAFILVLGMVINNAAFVRAEETGIEVDNRLTETGEEKKEAQGSGGQEVGQTVEKTPGEEQEDEPSNEEATDLKIDGSQEPESEKRTAVDWAGNQEVLQLDWSDVSFRQAGQEPVTVSKVDNCLDLSAMNPDTLEALQFTAGFAFLRDGMEGGFQEGDTFQYTLPGEYIMLEDIPQPVDMYLSNQYGSRNQERIAVYTVTDNIVTVTMTAEVALMPEGNQQGAMQLKAKLNMEHLGTGTTTVKAVLQNDRVTEIVLPAKAAAVDENTESVVLAEEPSVKNAKTGEIWGDYKDETVKKEWIDNNATYRPSLLKDELLDMEYSMDGGASWQSWSKGALGIEKPMSEWADEGIASVEAGGVGFETYRINLPHTDGTNEISYRFQENQVKVKEKGYIPFGQDGVFQNIITTNQTFQILLNTGAVTKSIHDFKGEIKLFGKNADGTPFVKSLADLGGDVTIEESTGKATIHNLPKFTVEQEEIVWSLDMTDASAQPDTGDVGDRYTVSYDNAASSNFGTVTDKCHEGGSLIISLTGKTNYQATKHWLDDKTGERPEAALYLWRYSQREGSDYTTASMVKNPNPDKAENIWWTLDNTIDEETVKTEAKDIAPEGLDKYDPEGYRYVYFTREELAGSGYTQQFGVYNPVDKEIKETEDMLPEGMDERVQGDTSVYNNGHISNLRTDTSVAAVTKRWEAASFQSQLEDVVVTFMLQQRTKDSAESGWQETGETAVMDGFFAEKLTQTITKDMPKYDQSGMELEYRWVESNVEQGDFDTQFTPNEDGTADFVLKQKDASGEEQEVAYKSLLEADGIITNKIADKTDYQVEKIWNDAVDHSKDTITVVLYRDNKRYAQYAFGADVKSAEVVGQTAEAVSDGATGEVVSSWNMRFDNLPKYDDTGHKYTYYAEEEPLSGYHASYEYDIENRKAKITNTPGTGGNVIRVRKDWIDDGDDTHRPPIKVEVYNKYDHSQIYAKEVWLKESHYWWQEVAVPEGITLEDCAIEEISTNQIQVDGNFADTEHHKYQVQYGIDEERQMLTVTNRRIGLIDITVRKYWVDDDNKKGDRTSDAELKLSCNEYPDAVSDSIANGTITVGDAKDWPIQDKDGNPVGSRQSVRTVHDAGAGYSEYYFFNLPKYDDTGKVLHYSVEEVNGSQNEYTVNIQEVSYQVGAQHSSDEQEIEITNKKSASKPVKFYKLWKDQYSFEKGTRPDIYLELYKTVANSDGTEGIQPVGTYIDRKWIRDSENEDYLWTCDFGELPKYDENGREIFYYAKEQTKVNAEAFDYVTDIDAVYDVAGIYKQQYGNAGTENLVGMADDTSQVLKENGTFVNRVGKTIIISGKKIWKNVPAGFPDADFPKLTIHVDQVQPGRSISQRAFGSSALPLLEGFRLEKLLAQSKTTGTELAETAELTRIPGTNNFTFQISADKNGKPIPKYDDNGALYQYEVRETVEDEAHLGTVYESLPGEVNNYIITNTYETKDAKNTGELKAEKSWFGISSTSEYQYPAVDFKLYRQYMSKDSTKNTDKISILGVEKRVTAPELVDEKRLDSGKKNTGEVEFDTGKLRIYAPNGNPYYYYVEETILNGYETKTGGVQSQKSQYLSLEGTAKGSAAFENSYKDPQEKVAITGTKEWKDYSNAFGTRPSAAEFANALQMERYTDAQSGKGGAPAIESQPVQLQTDDASAPYYFAWSDTEGDSWSYTISNLDRYAPSSMPWKYRITETVPQGYANEHNKINSAKGSVGADGTITMPTLTNTNSKTVSLTKSWQDDNAYGQRPVSIDLELWVKIGEGQWQTAQSSFQAYNAPDDVKNQYTYTLTEKDKKNNTWKHTFSNLPAYVSQGGRNLECQYQVIEVKAGDYTVDQTSPEFEVTDSGATYPAAGPYVPSGGNTSAGTTISNKINEDATGYIKLSKTWTDRGNIYDTRPAVPDTKDTWKTDYVLYRKAGTGAWEQVKTSDENYIILRIEGKYGEDAKERQYGPFQKVDAEGNTYSYAAIEVPVAGYGKTETIVPETDSLPNIEEAVTAGKIEIHTGEEVTSDAKISTTTTENTLEPTVDITAVKEWLKADGTPYTALDGKEVTVELKKKTAEGTESFLHPLTVTLDGTPDEATEGNRETEAWTALFEGAPQYRYAEDGSESEIIYTVEEVTVSGEETKPSVTEGFWNTVGETTSGPAVTVTNRQTEFALDKIDAGGDSIDRAVTLGIYKNTVTPTNKVAEWNRSVNDGTVTECVDKVNESSVETVAERPGQAKITGLAQGSYILHEEAAPAGYEMASDIAFTLGKDGKLTGNTGISDDGLTLAMTDTAISLKLRKLNQDDTEIDQEKLGYAEFEIKGTFADGSTEKQGITSEGLNSLDGLWIAGETYTFAETKAPAGYIRSAQSVELIFDKDGSLKSVSGDAGAIDQDEKETLLFKNEPISISVKKTDMKDVPLSGAAFALTDLGVDGNGEGAAFTDAKEVTTKADGTIALEEAGSSMVMYGHYYGLEETKAPDGYILPDSHPAVIFKVLDSGKVQLEETDTIVGNNQSEIMVKNMPIGMTLNKTDGTSKEPIDGAEFVITRDDGQSKAVTVLDEGTVRIDNTSTDRFLVQGHKYTVTEQKAPEGYELPTDAAAEFVVNENGTIQLDGQELEELTIENVRKSGSIAIRKIDGEEGNPLSGAEFALYKKADMSTSVKEAVTDTEGKAVLGELEWDSYVLKETKAPEGYILDSILSTEGIECTIKSDSLTPVITSAGAGEGIIENIKNRFTLTKTDEDGNMLDGAVFTLKDITSDKDISESLKDMKNTMTLSGILIGGHTYELQETKAPEGYKKAVEPVQFTLGTDGLITQVGSWTETGYAVSEDKKGITLTDAPTVFVLKKTAEDTKEPQEGVVFEITPESGCNFADSSTDSITATTDADGQVIVRGQLVNGMSYHVEETLAKTGYTYAESFIITVDDAGNVKAGDSMISEDSPHAVVDSPIAVGIQKVDDSKEGRPVKGIRFILQEEGQQAVIQLISDKNGMLRSEEEPATLSQYLNAGKNYVLTEIVEAGSPYIELPGTIGFKVEKNGIITLSVEEAVSRLVKLSDDKMTLTVTNNRTELQIQKTDSGNKGLEGAKLGVYTETNGVPDSLVKIDGKELSWTSEGEEYTIKGLPTGTYWLKETGAPAGYITADPIRFRIDSKGIVAIVNGEGAVSGNTITMTDEPVIGHVRLIKNSAADKETPVEGARFDLYQQKKETPAKDDILVAKAITTESDGEWTSEGSEAVREDDASKKLGDGLLAGTYYFKETYAPDEYQLDKETVYPFEIKGAGEEVVVQPDVTVRKAENVPYSRTLTIVKKDEVDKRVLAGAVFILMRTKDGAGNPVEEDGIELTTDEKGEAIFELHKKGTYRLKEITAPEGYELAEDKTVTVTDESPEHILFEAGESDNVITDQRKPGTVKLLKKDGADETALSGVQFTLYKENTEGNVFDRLWDFITGNRYQSVDSKSWTGEAVADGELVIDNLEWGAYYIKETKAADGYVPSDTEFHFVIGRYNSDIVLEVDKGTIENIQTEITFKKEGKYNEFCSDTRFEGAPDANAQQILQGVEFTAYSDIDCQQAEQTASSNEKGEVTFKKLSIGTHYIKETGALDGYRLNETVYRAVLDENGQFTGLTLTDGTEVENNTIVNDVYRTNITFTKVDEKNPSKVIPGSTYGLFKKYSDITTKTLETERLVKIAEAVTDAKGVLTFEGVLMDTEYIVRELKAADGSYLSEKPLKLSFSVNEAGEIAMEIIDAGDGTAEIHSETGAIIWKEPQVEVRFSKTDEQGNLLGEAELHIEDENGNTVEAWTSVAGETYQSYGVLTSGHKYKLVETKAPAGYLIAEPVYFEVESEPVAAGQDKVIEVTMVDKAVPKQVANNHSSAARTGDTARSTDYILWMTTAAAIAGLLYGRRRKNRMK